ncbi:exonuclease SbcCD subunit D [Nonomuraea sp. KC401]|uniref:Nuclease SbcCD subunit D n=1 Tax=Nonomuraea longispora TaxID=1848320 RepID=A0A4R4MP21_9ACTN|nr:MULTISPECIES: exonuclease SbcCD subunit D [Nonomuraea]NBE94070.1 exonuclease subunit SbcD [Nonomuraea sp. K271]TDB97734.1 exonuclease SbcCD subunit D [Nonomuraea longispora]TLF65132.1 exonuclease SbcCD subunit D [Nonomuraea sp. KC401]
MKILHTADWHVGKVLKGRPRVDEHRAVLRELVAAAREHDVDAVIVAGDLFDTSAPTPEAQALVLNVLMALRGDGRDVVVLAGNHDNPQLLEVYRPVLGKLGLHVIGSFRRPDAGGTLAFTARSGEPVRLAVLPFLSHRYVVRAAEVLAGTAAEHNRDYAARIAELIGALTAGFHGDTVNLVTTHGTLPGGAFGGGERQAQSIFSYYFEPTAFPPSTQYAALGHLHRRQQIPGPCPIWYSGSPLAVDFGEEGNTPGALLVEVSPGRPAVVRELAFGSARRLRTVRGTLEQLEGLEQGDDWLKVIVEEKPRVGLADDVRELLPGAVDVMLDERFRPVPATRRAGSPERGARELFREYLTATGRHDDQVAALFDRLHDEVTG